MREINRAQPGGNFSNIWWVCDPETVRWPPCFKLLVLRTIESNTNGYVPVVVLRRRASLKGVWAVDPSLDTCRLPVRDPAGYQQNTQSSAAMPGYPQSS